MGFNDSYPQSGNAYTANVRANFTAIKNVLSQAALDGSWIRAEVVTSDPTAGNKGRIIYNETEDVFKIDNGSSWVSLSTRIKVGSYTGNGNDNRSIIGLGFQPDAVFIHKIETGVSVQLAFKINDASVDQTWRSATSGTNPRVVADLIQALESDGFQVGADSVVNENGKTFNYFAMKGA
jgi:hypothetical protein